MAGPISPGPKDENWEDSQRGTPQGKMRQHGAPGGGHDGGGSEPPMCVVSFLVFLFLVIKPFMGFKA